MNQKEIGSFISKKRKEQKLTQKELADKLNISEKTISKWETGNGLPEVSNMQPLCNILNISVNELLNGKENPKEDKTVEYIEYKDKKIKRIFLYTVLVIIFIASFIIIDLFIKYKNYYQANHNQSKVYRLVGESENFEYNNLYVITLPRKIIMMTGDISSKNNDLIPRESIHGYSLKSEDELILEFKSDEPSTLQTQVFEENKDYNEIFTEEKINNISNWSIIIFYKKDGNIEQEEIKLEVIDENKSDISDYTDVAIKDDENDEDYPSDDLIDCKKMDLINKLIEKGFAKPVDSCSTYINLEDGTSLDVEAYEDRVSYLYNNLILDYYYGKKDHNIIVSGDTNGLLWQYKYNYKTHVQKCVRGKCPKTDKEAIDKLIEVTNRYMEEEHVFD